MTKIISLLLVVALAGGGAAWGQSPEKLVEFDAKKKPTADEFNQNFRILSTELERLRALVDSLKDLDQPNVAESVANTLVNDASFMRDVSEGLIVNLPRGTILAWNMPDGAKEPPGWRVCDGTGGTPDLRGRFLLGSGRAEVGETGGKDMVEFSKKTDGHALILAEIPSHTHPLKRATNTTGDGNYVDIKSVGPTPHKNGIRTEPAGSGRAHAHPFAFRFDNRPTFSKVVFIMKTVD